MRASNYIKFIALTSVLFCSQVFAADFTTKNNSNPSSAKLPDVSITTNVQSKISRDPTLSGLPIIVSTNQGVVTLAGTVNTKKEKLIAIKDAKSALGVKKVVSTQLTLNGHTNNTGNNTTNNTMHY